VPSEVVPGASMDPLRAATAIVARPACDLAAPASIVAAEAFEAAASVEAVEASEAVASVGAVEASEAAAVVVAVEAVVAGERRES